MNGWMDGWMRCNKYEFCDIRKEVVAKFHEWIHYLFVVGCTTYNCIKWQYTWYIHVELVEAMKSFMLAAMKGYVNTVHVSENKVQNPLYLSFKTIYVLSFTWKLSMIECPHHCWLPLSSKSTLNNCLLVQNP